MGVLPGSLMCSTPTGHADSGECRREMLQPHLHPTSGHSVVGSSLGRGCASEDGLLMALAGDPGHRPGRWPPWEQQVSPHSCQLIPASSMWLSEDSGWSREACSVPVARGLPGWASSGAWASCLGAGGSLCVARGPPPGLPTLLSAPAKKLGCQPSPSALPASTGMPGPRQAVSLPGSLVHPCSPLGFCPHACLCTSPSPMETGHGPPAGSVSRGAPLPHPCTLL